MGMPMPLSFFSAFWAVQDRDRPGGRKAAEVFGCFSLFAFVLYDPREDIALHERLQREWEILDGLTGPDLLFFAPVDPPKAWPMQLRSRGRGSILPVPQRVEAGPDRVSRERHYMPLVSRDPSQAVAAFRQLLGVPAGMGSCLVIASNLLDRQAWLLSTDEAHVGPQLERLGSLASLTARRSMTRQAVEPYIVRIAGEAEAIVEALALPVSLAAALTDVCAMTAVQGVDSDHLTEARARDQLRKSAYARTRVYDDTDQDTAILRLAQAGAVIAAMPDERLDYELRMAERVACPSPSPVHELSVHRVGDRSPVRDPRTSARTAHLLRIGDDCFRLIESGQIGYADQLDFRVAVAAWSQALEHEMAELLGHEVRAGLGVLLPEYYWRRQPGLTDIAVRCPSQRESISFNQARPNSPDPDRALWQPPAMGPLRLGWEAWRASMSAPVPRGLIDLLLQCKEFRNAASHPGAPINIETAQAAKATIRHAIGMIAGLGIRSWANRP